MTRTEELMNEMRGHVSRLRRDAELMNARAEVIEEYRFQLQTAIDSDNEKRDREAQKKVVEAIA